MSYQCANCALRGCGECDAAKTMPLCPSKNEGIQERAKALYEDRENHAIAVTAGIVEHEGYGRLSRMEEIILFAQRAGYKRIGLIFCDGLRSEAKQVGKILAHNGFEVVSAICKNGAIPKSHLGLTDEQTLSGCCDKEAMCNPIGQALLMNEEKTDFNILMGLCVGHDTLAFKYLERPVTVLAVKDRVTGHNPLAAIYMSEGYYKKRFFK